MIIKTEKLYCVLHSETGTVRIKERKFGGSEMLSIVRPIKMLIFAVKRTAAQGYTEKH